MIIKSKNNSYFFELKKRVYYLHPKLLNQIQKNSIEDEYYTKKLEMLNNNNHFDRHQFNFREELTKEILSTAIANTLCIDFEVTERCNLNCYYCAYGKFYNNRDVRRNKDLSFDQAIKFLDYIVEYLNSSFNTLVDTPIYIGFYGGEPLLNFKLIEQIVDYSKKIKLKNNNHFKYLMTTNGVLLNKYQDFIVSNDFLLTISLDGNEEANSFRTFHNRKESFNKVFNNVKKLKLNYPEYFEKRVLFNAVLHEKNSVKGVTNFFNKEFNKTPNLSYVSETGLNDEFLDEFNSNLFKLPESGSEVRSSYHVLSNYANIIKDEYFELFLDDNYSSFIPTGTCIPFSRRCYLSVNGKILPCERIGHEFALGHVDESGVYLDIDKIIKRLNSYYSAIKKSCNGCLKLLSCTKCIFCLDFKDGLPVCKEAKQANKDIKKLGNVMERMESELDLINYLMEEYNEI